MKTNDFSRIAIAKETGKENTVWKQIATLAGSRRKLLIGKIG